MPSGKISGGAVKGTAKNPEALKCGKEPQRSGIVKKEGSESKKLNENDSNGSHVFSCMRWNSKKKKGKIAS